MSWGILQVTYTSVSDILGRFSYFNSQKTRATRARGIEATEKKKEKETDYGNRLHNY